MKTTHPSTETSDGPSRERFDQLFGEMSAESDRGCILIGASAVDDVLCTLLLEHLSGSKHITTHAAEPLFAGMGPLSTFSARIKLAYALELTPRWMFEDLEKIRKVRNKAAHEVTAKTFESREVVQITQSLHGANLTVGAFEGREEMKAPSAEEKALSEDASANESKMRMPKERLRFTLTVVYVAGYLEARRIRARAASSVKKLNEPSVDAKPPRTLR